MTTPKDIETLITEFRNMQGEGGYFQHEYDDFIRHIYASALAWGANRLKEIECEMCGSENNSEICRSILLSKSEEIMNKKV